MSRRRPGGDQICTDCGHAKSIHGRPVGALNRIKRGAWACAIADCPCRYSGPFRVRATQEKAS
jgi:hypothetical protein